ncbi:hypothetical protein AAS21_gp184 [Pantoea phage vB_PagS_AAS21]|uniref:Uncharacterized protein n=1 Tax=Pantoea phage vB_PagS_AAS21 TaxID=2575261 RepID=A0A4Y5P1V3_9CAUD|nr:hypothetical protein AAS21_gp184 [Pantoea phage vB_PagS_AAS21]
MKNSCGSKNSGKYGLRPSLCRQFFRIAYNYQIHKRWMKIFKFTRNAANHAQAQICAKPIY